MTDPDSSRALTRGQARLLLDPGHYGLLQCLLRGEVSASEAARDLGWPLQRAHYKLGRFVKAGLARVAREDKRAGRAVKRYVSARPEWFVPFELTPAGTLGELIAGQLEPRMRLIYEALAADITRFSRQQGVTLYMQDGTLTVQLAPKELAQADARPDTPTLAQLTRHRLSPTRARALGERWRAVLQEFPDEDDPDARTFSLAVFFIEGDVT